MNGVSPEGADSSSVSGLRSENRTRFLELLGVAGGVDMNPDFGAGRLVPTVMPLFLLTAGGRSPTVIVTEVLESAMMYCIWWDNEFKQRRKCVYTKDGHEKLLCEKYLRKKEN
jgi:uncharacterized protein YodC (DUF2158 family)